MTTRSSATEHVVIVGGSSGIGLALADTLLADGAEVTIVGRSADRLALAAKELDGPAERLHTVSVDVGREEDVVRLFAATGRVDHIVTTAADAAGVYQAIGSFDIEAARTIVDSKLIGALLLAKHGASVLAPGGSIALTSGIAAYRPAPGGSLVAAVNGALASLAYALAIELAPIRVNVISPGWVDTPIWDAIAGDNKTTRLAAMAERLPVGRVGTPHDIAQAFLSVLHNGFITGTVVHADGGQRLV
jgi:NAD(P)-dependent dehydrogenase (short-subunit alcohol dehydrogenase family)